MEEQTEIMIDGKVERLKHYPELRARMKQHLDETRSQVERIEMCLKRMGEDTSAMKDAGGEIMARRSP